MRLHLCKPVLTFLQSKIVIIEATIARRLAQVQLQNERKEQGQGQDHGPGLKQGLGLGPGLEDGGSGSGGGGSGGGGGGDVNDGNQSVSDDALLLETCNSLLDQACWL